MEDLEIQHIYNQYQKYLTEIKSSNEKLIEFVSFASRVYKHSFHAQVMAFGHNKNATHIADERTWNKIGRQLTDQNAIKTIVKKNDEVKIIKLYDVSQTHGADISKYIINQFKLSNEEYKKLYKNQIPSQLAKEYIYNKQYIEYNFLNNISKEYILAFLENTFLSRLESGATLSSIPDISKMSNEEFMKIGISANKIVNAFLSETLEKINNIRSVNYGTDRLSTNANTELHRGGQDLDGRGQTHGQIRENPTEIHGRPLSREGGATSHNRTIVRGDLSSSEISQRAIPLNTRATSGEARTNGRGGGHSQESGTSQMATASSGRNNAGRNLQTNLNENQFNIFSAIQENKEIKAQSQQEVEFFHAQNYALDEIPIDNNYGGAKTRFNKNIKAIEVLFEIERENRIATKDEQEILSQYLGFGGLSKAFDENDTKWKNEYTLLQELLSEEEYTQARRSTLNAHYTTPQVIDCIYKAVEGFGFNGGKILEPAMGIGNFYSVLPQHLSNSELHGVELDSISGRISKQLYPNAEIQIKGFQDTDYTDNTFDLCIGNVPFGDYKIPDKRYKDENFLIHDYFFAKALDLVKPNGIIAFITSKGTLDKANSSVRKYLSQRADLLGAVRLPSNTFMGIADTKVTTDILFFQKREKEIVCEPNWIHLTLTDNEIPINQYFADNPQFLLGEMVKERMMYGHETTSLSSTSRYPQVMEELQNAVYSMVAKHQNALRPMVAPQNTLSELSTTEALDVIPANPNIKPYTYTFVDNVLYYRENTEMIKQTATGKVLERVKGMCEIRDTINTLFDIQLADSFNESYFNETLTRLNSVYDNFVKKHGYITLSANETAFRHDEDYPLLSSIENKTDEKDVFTKGTIFFKPTLIKKEEPTINSALDALTVSLYKKGKLDLGYMSEIYGNKEVDSITQELGERVFFNPATSSYETAEEYLSGNVKLKLDYAMLKAEEYPELSRNVQALKDVQPERLSIANIQFSIGTSWIPLEMKKQFIYEIVNVPSYLQETEFLQKGKVYFKYDETSTRYTIYNKPLIRNIHATSTYGTARKNALELIEESLNLKITEVKDRVTIMKDGKETERYVINMKETQIARGKQEKLEYEFKNWILNDHTRIQILEDIYNNNYNVYVNRKYDGSNISLNGMTNQIELKPHQKDAVMRIALGGNTLLAHEVGAGKTFTMIAGAMLLKQTGIAQKSIFVVPNHLINQWGKDFLRLFPKANILVADKKDFEKNNRKRFLSRIATGEYDAIIMSFTQFERIPMSAEFQEKMIREEIESINKALENSDDERSFSVKQLEKRKIKLEEKITSLFENERKDNLLPFDKMGITNIFIDEADYYKNCYIHTKIQNVAGLGGTSAEKSFDMLMKTTHINEATNYKGIVFATGTPITNSISEMFVMKRYLQNDILKQTNQSYFDQWASNYTKIENVLEISPEGTGFRNRSRFSKFHNLPELMQIFSLCADIKLIEDLDIARPNMFGGKPQTIVVEPSEFVKEKIAELSERAETIRNGGVDPTQDNMLKITTEGKAYAIDPRIKEPHLETSKDSKIYAVCDKVHELYVKYNDDKALQLIFLDSGLNMYQVIKDELIEKGVDENEIKFIHEAKTDKQKADLFEKCRNGDVRVLIGSTSKMGAGTNLQDRLIALHHTDCPWRPRDIEQRNGRILRQGNRYDEVYIYQYITKGTFDSYLWQIQEQKQKFISQVMTNKSYIRECDDLDDTVLNYAEVKALATGDTRIKDKMELDNLVQKLQLEKQSFIIERQKLAKLIEVAPDKIARTKFLIEKVNADITTVASNKIIDFKIVIDNKTYEKRTDAGHSLKTIVANLSSPDYIKVGEYRGLDILACKESLIDTKLKLCGEHQYHVDYGTSELGNITKIENVADKLYIVQNNFNQELEQTKSQFEFAKLNVDKAYEKDDILKEKIEEKSKLDYEIESSLSKPKDTHLEM